MIPVSRPKLLLAGRVLVVAALLFVALSQALSALAASWPITTVGTSSLSVGVFSSVAVSGEKDFVGYDYTDGSGLHLRLSTYECVHVTSPGHCDYEWTHQIIDTFPSLLTPGGGVTIPSPGHNSLALDPVSGLPQVSYYDPVNGALKYAYYVGAGGLAWLCQTIDGGGSLSPPGCPMETPVAIPAPSTAPPQVGFYNSLAVDSQGLPHIAYSYKDKDSSKLMLKYATLHRVYAPSLHANIIFWSTEVVDDISSNSVGQYASIGVDRTGRIHISGLPPI